MNDDPTEVDVLYAKVHACDILQTLADNVVDYCCNAGNLILYRLIHSAQRVEEVVEETWTMSPSTV